MTNFMIQAKSRSILLEKHQGALLFLGVAEQGYNVVLQHEIYTIPPSKRYRAVGSSSIFS